MCMGVLMVVLQLMLSVRRQAKSQAAVAIGTHQLCGDPGSRLPLSRSRWPVAVCSCLGLGLVLLLVLIIRDYSVTLRSQYIEM